MRHVHLVAVPDGIDQNAHILPSYIFLVLDLGLGEAGPLPDRLVQLPSRHKLQNKHNAVILLKNFVDVDDIGMVESDQHLDLVFGRQEITLAYFSSKYFPGGFVDSLLDCAVGSIYINGWVRPIISYN